MDDSDEELYLDNSEIAESDVILGDDVNIKLRTDLIDLD